MRLKPSLLILACLTLTGCYGSHESVTVLTTSGGAPLPGAQCSLSNAKGTWVVTTPGSVSVHLGSEPLDLNCMKDGYQPTAAEAHSSVHVAAIIVAPTWSTVNGSAWTYPQMITVPMQPALSASAATN